MERHNNQRKYSQYSKIITWLYIIAGADIVLLPFLQTTTGANIIGYESPFTYIFAAFALLGLILFLIIWFKNDSCRDDSMKLFNPYIPLAIAAIALIVFLLAGDFFVNQYVEHSNYKGSLTWAVCGDVKKISFWWGPFIYCICLAGASYFIKELNSIIKELHNGQY